MDKEFFLDWEISDDRCDDCNELLRINWDFPYCEDCGSHIGYACLNCMYWYDHVWPEQRKQIDL